MHHLRGVIGQTKLLGHIMQLALVATQRLSINMARCFRHVKFVVAQDGLVADVCENSKWIPIENVAQRVLDGDLPL